MTSREGTQFQFDVFLSFATADVDHVIPIYQSLVSNGKRVFRYDEAMHQHGGQNFVHSIDHALMDSRDFVICWTPAAHASPWVREEYRTFYGECYVPGHARRLIVYSPDVTADELLPPHLRQFQRVRSTGELLKSVGITVAAPGDLLSQLQPSGILGVYVARTSAISEFLPFLAEEPREIMIFGSSLLGVLRETRLDWEESRAIIQGKANANCDVRILLTHPAVADLRAHQEQRTFTELGREILETVRVLIEEWKLPRSSIRFYGGVSPMFGIKTSAAMLLSPSSYLANTFASPTLILRHDGYMYDHYQSTHFRAWDSAAAMPLPEDLDALSRNLTAYSSTVTELLKTLRDGDATS